jgi:paraquat-inducible protein A
MVDVFLLAACIGYFRLDNVTQARISIDVGGSCFIAAAFLTMLSRATLDRRTVWRAIGGERQIPPGASVIGCWTCDLIQPVAAEGAPCPRCGAKLYARKRRALLRTAALLLAALLLVAPSNLYPMNVSNQLGRQLNYTIFTGVHELFKSGLWPLGAVVFCTSILIPVGKIIAIGWCVLSVWRRSAALLITKTRLFRMVAELGRWSKADPFTIVFFVPLMNFGPLGSDTAGWGATAFLLMTTLTMFATNTFDPRLMWDAAEGRPA